MPQRTFIALPLDEPILDRLAEAQRTLAEVGADVRWVEPENQHVTLKFLGYVEDVETPEICRVAAAIAAELEGFEFSVTGLTATPPAGQMRMVWANITDPTGRLSELNARLEDAFTALGFKMENRQYHPHLTVGRVKTGQRVPELRAAVGQFAGTDFGTQSAEEIIVFASELASQGPIYTPLAKARLG